MALALARSLAAAGGFDAGHVLEAYKRWLKSRPVDFTQSVFRAMHGKVDARSQTNSALIRVSPLGILGARFIPDEVLPCDDGASPSIAMLTNDHSVLQLIEWAMEEAALTNPHPLCRVASACYVVAIACGIRGAGRELMHSAAMKTAEYLTGREELVQAASQVRLCLETARSAEPEDYQENMSHVLTTLQNGFWQLLHAADGGEGVRASVMHGGDSAANGAVAGALLGAALDIDTFPAQWTDAVLACLPEEGRQGVGRPRPKEYWPLDFMPLAESLLR